MQRARGPAELWAAAITFAACLLVGLLQGQKPFYFDAANYWALSKSFTSGGHFSLFNYDYTGVRGYSLPLVYFLLRTLTGGIITTANAQVVVFNSALFAAIGGVLGPRIAQAAWPKTEWGLLRRLILAGLLLAFWSGFLSFPLSDFPALAAAMLAIVAVAAGSPAWLFVAGCASAFAVNARPAYLVLVVFVAGLVLANTVRGWRRGQAPLLRRLAGPTLFFVGLAAITIPQSLVQHHTFGDYSPLAGGNDLAALQYTAGLKWDRLEVYVGAPYWAVMEYRDPDTTGILDGLKKHEVRDTTEYAELFIEHPLTMTGLFARHLIDGLDHRYTTPYIEHLEPPSRKLLRLAGFVLVFGALLRVCWGAARRSLGSVRWRYPVALLLADLTSIPTAMEQRFMLPTFILSLLLCLAPGWPSPLRKDQSGVRRYRTVAIIALAGAAFLVTVGITVREATHNLALWPITESPLVASH